MSESLEWFKDVARVRGLKITHSEPDLSYIIYWTSNEGYRHRLFYHYGCKRIYVILDDDIKNNGDAAYELGGVDSVEKHIFDKYIEMVFRRWP